MSDKLIVVSYKLSSLVLLILALLAPEGFAQLDGQTAPAVPSEKAEVKKKLDKDPEKTSSEDKPVTPKKTDKPKKKKEDYVATEEISEDRPVAFPVDI